MVFLLLEDIIISVSSYIIGQSNFCVSLPSHPFIWNKDDHLIHMRYCNLLAVTSPMSSCQMSFHLFKADTQGELSSRHQAATYCVACRYGSWLSQSIIQQRLLFSYWPHWYVIIRNNLAEYLIGIAPSRKAFIKARHRFLQKNFQTILNKGQMTPFSKCKWTGRRHHSDKSHQKKFINKEETDSCLKTLHMDCLRKSVLDYFNFLYPATQMWGAGRWLETRTFLPVWK